MTDSGLPIPDRSAVMRADAVVDTSRISVVEDAASKDQVALGPSGTRLQTQLLVRARVGEPTDSTVVWADLHVFDAMDELIHTGSIRLEQGEPSRPGAELRLWDAEVYSGSGGGSGMSVWSRPDAHTIQYRVYCQVADQVCTDGVLHQFEVMTDSAVRRIPGGW